MLPVNGRKISLTEFFLVTSKLRHVNYLEAYMANIFIRSVTQALVYVLLYAESVVARGTHKIPEVENIGRLNFEKMAQCTFLLGPSPKGQ